MNLYQFISIEIYDYLQLKKPGIPEVMNGLSDRASGEIEVVKP